MFNMPDLNPATIAGILALLVAALLGIYNVRKDISANPKRELGQSKFTIFLKAIFEKIFPPRIKILVKDIDCNVSQTEYRDGTSAHSKQRIQWYIICLIELKNRSLKTANEIDVSVELQIGDNNIFRKPNLRVNQLSAGSGIYRELITFQSVFLDEKRIEYPDASYKLNFSYTCKEYPGLRTAKASGKLSKSDWIGERKALPAMKTYVQ